MTRTTIARALLCWALLTTAAAPSAVAQPVANGTSFFEPFDTIDPAKWYISDGWTNGAHQGCTWLKSHVVASGGVLQLRVTNTATKDRPYGCGEIQTTKNYGYGLYEVRMRTAAGSGLNTAMFTYMGPPNYNSHDEIDFEFLGKAPNAVQLNYYVGGQGGHESINAVPGGAAAGYHVYAFEWTAESLKWYIDGQLVRTAAVAPLPRLPTRIFLSLWMGTAQNEDWLGRFAYPGTPITADIDWIAYTAPGQACLFPQSLRCPPG